MGCYYIDCIGNCNSLVFSLKTDKNPKPVISRLTLTKHKKRHNYFFDSLFHRQPNFSYFCFWKEKIIEEYAHPLALLNNIKNDCIQISTVNSQIIIVFFLSLYWKICEFAVNKILGKQTTSILKE